MENGSGIKATASSLVRLDSLLWILLFATLAIFGPDRTVVTVLVLIGLAGLQLIEPKLGGFSTAFGGMASLIIKFSLCYVLIGWTDGVASSYYWILLFPVVSAATSLELKGAVTAIAVACLSYLSFLLFLDWGRQYIPAEQLRELYVRALLFPVAGLLTHQLATAIRVELHRNQTTSEQLREANRNLQEAEAAMRRTERLAAIGQLSAGLAHELRNPLGTMKASAEMIVKKVSEENAVVQEMAQYISSEVDRTNALVTRFLDFARPLAPRLERADIHQSIDQAVAEIDRHLPTLDIAIYKNYSPDIRPFPLDAELMTRVFFNLLLNAAQASSARGAITVKTRESGDGRVEIAVIDSGTGIDEKLRETIFNPFFTTKPAGVGLGLAIVHKIVEEHGGEITVESDPGNGSVFRVFLPEGNLQQ